MPTSTLQTFVVQQLSTAVERAERQDWKLYAPWEMPTSHWCIQWEPSFMDTQGDLGRSSSNWQIGVVIMGPDGELEDFLAEIDPTVEGSLMFYLKETKFNWNTWEIYRETFGEPGALKMAARSEVQILGLGVEPD